ncbi:sodium channel protein Nach-like [Copidosoma floridanum]|uniref:sodium channel protein Nach-like n=1 Tax=Copidosoma floridanum TaxID=29053 RepID=UPI000C6F7FBC|nr:sodium channel protein Nach-like [Copidosoma floridanum]
MTYKHGFKEETRRAGKFWKSLLRQYCENTSLHGFRYVVSNETTFVEKILWLVVCVLGFFIALLLMLFVWQKFRRTPTVTTIDTTTYPIFNLAFPAVSICNYNKVYKPHAEKFSKRMKQKGLNNTEILNFFTSLPQLVRPNLLKLDNKRALEFLALEGISIEDVMYEMMQPCESLLLRCSWEGKTYDCKNIFRPIKSVEGFCCAFNYHVNVSMNSTFGIHMLKNNSFIKSPEAKNIVKDKPVVHRVMSVPGAGRDVGLSVVLNLEENTYMGSIRPSLGASILVHDPFTYPEVELLTSFIQPTQETAMILSASIMVSSESVRSLSNSQRNCWFTDEKQLSTSSIYSYQSCITECRIKYIQRYCDCVPFYYPNFNNDRVCNLPDIECLLKYRGSLSNLRTVIDLATENNTLDSADCECLPTCDENTYTSNTENALMDNVPYYSQILEGFNVKNVSLANIYFRSITCLKYRKESWMSWDNVLASFGGIFGLCLGGSFVSLVEFLYYFVHKLLYNSGDDTFQSPVVVKPSTLSQIKLSVPGIEKLEDLSRRMPNRPISFKGISLLKDNRTYHHELNKNTEKVYQHNKFVKSFLTVPE